jgi:predicted unusual protein kinase regulating ubiquinone biosynthesis (AarF/ABC1/UbiB family)
LVVDEFGEKLLEELDYRQEMRNIQEFYTNFEGDANVKIPWVRPDLCGQQTLVMEWIDGVRCTDPDTIQRELDVQTFIKVGVVSGLRQLLEVRREGGQAYMSTACGKEKNTHTHTHTHTHRANIQENCTRA